MKLCGDTITVFNRRIDEETGYDVYIPVVIRNVSWYSTIATSIDTNGLHAADQFIIRIPVDADFGGRSYLDPITYKNAADVSGLFTLSQGDVVVKAAITTAPAKIADVVKAYSQCCTILGVTDNRRAPNAPHWKVVGS